MFIHEDMEFHDVLSKIIRTLGREDLSDTFNFDVHAGKIVCAPWDLHYSIARTSLKNIELISTDDFNVMVVLSPGTPEFRSCLGVRLGDGFRRDAAST